MKRGLWAYVVAGAFLIGSVVLADAAGGGSRGGSHGGGGSWSGAAPRGSAWVSGGGYRGGGGRTYVGASRGSAWVSGGGYRGYYGGGYRGYHGGGYHGGGWYGGTRVYIGGGVGWWGWPGWWGPGYWGSGWWGAPYPYYAAPPVVVQPEPTTYIQQEPAPPADAYWYYCEQARAYYPYVKACPGGWMKVVPQSAPADR